MSREFSKAQEENRSLKEALPEAQRDLAELRRRLEEHNRCKAQMLVRCYKLHLPPPWR